jgi:hypothetical protein
LLLQLLQFYVAEDRATAVSNYYPGYERLMNHIAEDRGLPLMTREKYDLLRKEGPLVVGNVQEAIDK